LAHYYVNDEIQAIADYVGDSYYLCKVATTVTQSTIVFCGVSFMGESAKILNPNKRIIMPDMDANCPMANMAECDMIQRIRKQYKDLAVVCYINSTAEVKSNSDVCVTSSNALQIVKSLRQKNIYFIPDENLARYVASFLPEKNFIFNDGFCHVHTSIKKADVERAQSAHPGALLLAHPECTFGVLAMADYVGSTSGIIEFATNSEAEDFIICTEIGILYELKKRNPNKKFHVAHSKQICPDMKKITIEKVVRVLENSSNLVELEDTLRQDARHSIEKMLVLAASV
jgi:quinolinate synthase